ncbi:hypothetical protein NQ315_014114 [Exocentrus adspersus]|uniref:Uncharacterized protein n=1 Tax=Exocentrus adspersus TaxID=1586481 RepID=A0AAV8VVN0_9CUCU|nr:hypothetical protein NQ315_014114 [Exocentrus adspersus]
MSSPWNFRNSNRGKQEIEVPRSSLRLAGPVWRTLYVCAKAQEKNDGLGKAKIPNVGGPKLVKRQLLASVVQSILLYTAPVWTCGQKDKKIHGINGDNSKEITPESNFGLYNGLQRYISGTPPINLLAEERKLIYEKRPGYENSKEARIRTIIDKWQEELVSHADTAQWTKRLIPNIVQWWACKYSNKDYFFTQVSTGHGSYFRRNESTVMKDRIKKEI